MTTDQETGRKVRLSVIPVETQLIHFYQKGIAVNSQNFGGLFTVVVHVIEDFADILMLEVADGLFERHAGRTTTKK